MRAGRRGWGGQRGFTYVTVMTLVALLGLGLAQWGPLWAEQAQREREQELLRVGGLYAQAIESYWRASPGSVRQLPMRLEDLLLDTRYVGTRRHLRRIYADPLRPDRPWGLLRDAEGRLRGVYSQDPRQPFARAARGLGNVQLPDAQRYSDWVFTPKDLP
jgi:type II secretory pathway pseudopilin PulG